MEPTVAIFKTLPLVASWIGDRCRLLFCCAKAEICCCAVSPYLGDRRSYDGVRILEIDATDSIEHNFELLPFTLVTVWTT